MRDIRDDLQERLDGIATERVKLQAQVAALEALEATFKTALREEEVRIAKSSMTAQTKQLPFPATTSMFLGDVIKRVMKAKDRPLATDEIRDDIVNSKAFDFGEKKPGRSVHFGLVSLQNGGAVQRLPDGRWTMHNRNGVSVQEKPQ